MKKYDNFISIGFFCSVAQELERIGLRSTSGPFDWLICSADGMSRLIESRFEHFLDTNVLLQDPAQRNHYYNPIYGIWFYHDFSKYKSLEEQIDNVKKKYRRRISRFYSQIYYPTLFVRYIANSNELDWWNDNIDFFVSLIKKYNSCNDVLFIANEGFDSSKFFIYHVKPDDFDSVARRPIDKNEKLRIFLESIPFAKREVNLKFYHKKKKKYILKSIVTACTEAIKKPFLEEYIHNQIYGEFKLSENSARGEECKNILIK